MRILYNKTQLQAAVDKIAIEIYNKPTESKTYRPIMYMIHLKPLLTNPQYFTLRKPSPDIVNKLYLKNVNESSNINYMNESSAFDLNNIYTNFYTY